MYIKTREVSIIRQDVHCHFYNIICCLLHTHRFPMVLVISSIIRSLSLLLQYKLDRSQIGCCHWKRPPTTCPVIKCALFILVCSSTIFTRGQFWPSGIVIACVCVCVRVCVCQSVWQSHNLGPVQARIAKFNFKIRIYPILNLSGP